MPRFRVEVKGENLGRALMVLNGSGIPTIATFPGFFVEQGPPEGFEIDQVQAVFDAEDEAKAEARVRDALPADGGYTVEPAEPAV